jgi:hypothetical protein
MKTFSQDTVRELCEVIYELVGRSDEDPLDVGLLPLGVEIARGYRPSHSLLSKATRMILHARSVADVVMHIVSPETQQEIAARGMAFVNKANDEPNPELARDAAESASELIDAEHLAIVQTIRKLVTLAVKEKGTEEGRTAASAACKLMRKHELLLGPKRAS